jgi:hypothetical protein
MEEFSFGTVNESLEHYIRKINFAVLLKKSGFDIYIEPTPNKRSNFLNKYGIRDHYCECIPDIVAIKPDFHKPIWIEIQITNVKKYSLLDWKRIKNTFLYLEVYSNNFWIYLQLIESKIRNLQRIKKDK